MFSVWFIFIWSLTCVKSDGVSFVKIMSARIIQFAFGLLEE